MNGRVYDPLVGRMMSADPTIPNPYGLQSFNRYAYVYNNPLKLFDPTGFEPFGTDSSGQRTQYSDTGNGTVSNTYTGNTYAVDSGSNGYQPSRSTYGNGISAQNVAGPSGQGAAPVATYNSSTGQWNLTDYGQQLGSKNNTYATIVSDAVGDRTYRQIGQRDFKSPAVDLLAAAWQYFLARLGFRTGPKPSTITINVELAAKEVSLTAEQAKNIARFEKRLPANAKESLSVKSLPNEGVAVQGTSPGNVPGSSAVYEKQIDAAGKTIQATKTTYDPAGNIVHVKDKLNGGVFP
jgi:hypothetical protein